MNYRLATLLVLSAVLVSCGKFEAIKPDPNQIVSLKNTSLRAAEVEGEFLPTPLPEGPELPGLDLNDNAKLEAPTQPDINVDPYTAMGKLTYTKNGEGWQCSGQLVGDGDVLLTAAHCVYDTKKNIWAGNFNFKRGYRNGSYNQSFDWDCTAIFSGWIHDSWAKDYAFIKLRSKGLKKLGIRPNSPVPSIRSVGYPSNFESGEILHQVQGLRGYQAFGVVEMKGNPFGPGSSGGGWLDSDDFAIGVNSFGKSNKPNSMFGPVFDGQTTRLYEFVRRGCSHDVLPLGEDPGVAGRDKDATIIMADQRDVGYGARIKEVESSECGCEGAMEIVLENEGDEEYEVSVRYGAYSSEKGELISEGAFGVRVPGKTASAQSSPSRKILGCNRGQPGGGKDQCNVDLRYIVDSMQRVVKIATIGGETRQAITPEFCQDQCLNNEGGGYCRELGEAGKPILKQLAGFLADSLDRPPNSDGVTTTKKELIEAFGGDPNKEDPCERSDFYRAGDDVSNDGQACIALSPALTELPLEPRLTMRTPSKAVASRLPGADGQGTSAAFAHRDNAPAIEFVSTADTEAKKTSPADDLNKLYGGKVQHVRRLASQLIATTEHGCLIGEDVQ